MGRCTWSVRQDGIWKRAKHIWLDLRGGGREQTGAIMAKEVTGGRRATESNAEESAVIYRGEKPGSVCAMRKRGSGKLEPSKIVHIKTCGLKSGGETAA